VGGITPDLTRRVGELMREAAATAILPRFRHLKDGDIREKSPGELVTVADEQAEAIISRGLLAMLPGSFVIGEEAASNDSLTLARVADGDSVWLVDPLDGTANFAAAKPEFAVMVALLERGATTAAWILDPVADTLTVASRGGGAFLDGIRMSSPQAASPIAGLRGIVATRFLPPDLRTHVTDRFGAFASVTTGVPCAGQVYPDLVRGAVDFILFWRTLPWDHAAGALLVGEAGGRVARLGGRRYNPGDNGSGLLVARTDGVWDAVVHELFDGAPSITAPAPK